MTNFKLPRFKLPFLDAFRLRILFRGAFLLLIAATLYLALFILQQEKQLAYHNYQQHFLKTKQQITATLRHPSGHLALLNPNINRNSSPVLLPFASVDFDDQNKVQQAMNMAGCMVQYKNGNELCVGVGSNPWAGGFIYVVGQFSEADLVSHTPGELAFNGSHRASISVSLRGNTYSWLAPFEETQLSAFKNTNIGVQGRLTGFNAADVLDGTVSPEVRPNKEFRGWLWQNAYCQDTAIEPTSIGCKKRSYFSVRLPIQVLQDDLFASQQASNARPVWPPADLSSIKVAIEVLPPADYSSTNTSLFDSNDAIETPRFALQDLKPLLLAGETLTINSNKTQQKNIITGLQEGSQKTSALLTHLIKWLPVHENNATTAMQTSAQISTETDTFDLSLVGNIQSINQSLSVVASRVAWYVGAMLIAIALIWLLIEIGIIRRIIKLTKRAAMLSNMVKNTNNLAQFQLADMRGVDEIGVLSSCLHDLLQRVKGDVERETIRVAQERDMWNAVGHEIMSPLQSLIALHGQPDDPSQRYINRMQQAIRVLYGSASPSEAFETTQLQITRIDIVAFLNSVANNAASAGIARVFFNNATKKSTPIFVNADEYSLEDVITHVLKNADRFRVANSVITMQLQASENAVSICIHNDGPNIEAEFMDKIFEYGVSDQLDAAAVGNRGQGLFVAKTYMAKMGGAIAVENTAGGVSFILSLQRTIGV